ncbi:hypothetical protein AVEN_37680-1 [Araneus ventricosus]|uniref:Uncharacterized protein n=1 Tax=Araneus ventricosus TaxID=182803 RepID=A0A4Y2NMX9_ARAVE|nr:hypothetical protein AVEN_37680-1 [Araneus ventricosus]
MPVRCPFLPHGPHGGAILSGLLRRPVFQRAHRPLDLMIDVAVRSRARPDGGRLGRRHWFFGEDAILKSTLPFSVVFTPHITLPAIQGNKAVSVLLLLISSLFFLKGGTQVALTETGCKKDPNKDNWTPITLINEAIYLPDHPSKEGKRLKPAVLGVEAKPVDRLARYERIKHK